MTVTVVGIGADGWPGLAGTAQRELQRARIVHGGPRQLALLTDDVRAARRPWPTPLLPAVDALPDGVHVLASGDPMLHGIGATLARRRPDLELKVLPHVSSVSLACARLGWAVQDVAIVSAVARDAAPLVRHVRMGQKVLVLSESGATPADVRSLLDEARVAADVTVLERLGADDERIGRGDTAVDDLNVVAVEPATPQPFELEHDGQITKPDVRALTVAALEPVPGQRIWDIGAGSGSVGIASAAVHGAELIAVEARADRAERVVRNAAAAGVRATVVVGRAPEALAGLPDPGAIFVGGGLTNEVAETCLGALPVGGRLVANVVTVENQALAIELHRRYGGTLRQYVASDLTPLGAANAWSPRRPLVQWAVTR
ncbi:precorrin-6y C5,15-methyltransferase (decarboxylating) subunit CbiE [Tsukamurella sp. 8F]|uniref:precorrin-6y C5,15-methyltransferase (decarboxylating) subunit CbiE n=1 Tax=unclassified Tsukamurella TaxID=2633480 RepID=UPI0023B9C1EB|nr:MULTISPECIES: precorrin-6y C5,15-methyltransferase (decarboxylating) subunit CbiE [unclassified Tsukamurella]MDF0530562.1 precorrin-6y C5,15-methyltransferase (decarboxylating) subunit CbiE [Tsukamurella sp. 8J]MDF0586788.1 precorrin-6y C5,15-methyltransferase (decarboxylating) subunit CbiE [Tsukamurella sp. 8F]